MAQVEEPRENSPASRLLQCLAGLDSEEVLQICADASALQSPLLQAVASEKARHLVSEREQASWRHNVSGEHHFCPLHQCSCSTADCFFLTDAHAKTQKPCSLRRECQYCFVVVWT